MSELIVTLVVIAWILYAIYANNQDKKYYEKQETDALFLLNEVWEERIKKALIAEQKERQTIKLFCDSCEEEFIAETKDILAKNTSKTHKGCPRYPCMEEYNNKIFQDIFSKLKS